MKVLQLCHKPPYPKVDGGCIAMAAITEGFPDPESQLRILTTATQKHPWKPSAWPKKFLDRTAHLKIDTTLRPLKAIANLFGSGSYNVERFYSSEFESILKTELDSFQPDIVWLESLFMTPYIPLIRKVSSAKIILRGHNVEHKIWERMADNCPNFVKRHYLKFLARRMKILETEIINTVDGIAALTDLDLNFFQTHSNVDVRLIPIGINVESMHWKEPVKPISLFHLGDMNWEPNREAIEHFIANIWPVIESECPQAVCHLAGRNMPQNLISMSKNGLQIIGDVEDAQSFFSAHTVLILPLLSGGGMRVKLLEAMSLGKIVITTTVGAEGLNGTDGVHYLIADSAHDFAQHVKKIYSDEMDLTSISQAARQLVEDKFSNSKISADVNYFCEHLARGNQH